MKRYLTFDDPNNISLDTREYSASEIYVFNFLLDVFNTECHPFKAPPALPNYGSGQLVDNSQSFQVTKTDSPPVPISADQSLPTPLQNIFGIDL